MRQALRTLIILAFSIPVATATFAQAGTTITDGILDSIELSADAPEGGQSVMIHLFDASKADLGTGAKGGKAARVEAVRRVQEDGPEILSDSFVAESKKLGTFGEVAKASGDGGGDLVVEGRFTIMDPGSKAKRYWAGFGAGKGRTEIEGTVKDASGNVLAKFRHKRLIVMGVGGGDYVKKMRADCRRLGEDVAKFLDAWVKGRKLD
ncbi:MAG: DUF4410 domain-containing protein [bacterium]|nr:DUF4410 domain-containing protein [bacterium]